ncbi:MAG TPA: T9SS type A sorting domain-containing protein [Bacteroidales bacterium]|nr:T9SS type A sorting domain-containing protein [Bacteroidales bacterium]HPS63305.1 T9SS type A sorting domain-containing protein [Bacteroidales bacterium]
MKTFFISLLMLALSTGSYSQIQLEHDYAASATLTNLAVSGWKYYLMDVTTNQCRLYNMNHSLWKTISLSVPSGMYLYDVRYVTETLFNTDNKVELAYIYYSYDTTLYYYTYYTKIINEEGTVLLSIPGCSYVDVIAAGSSGTKMLAYVYDYSVVNWTINTLVYSVPGTLVADGDGPEGVGTELLPYPNPAGNWVTIPTAGHAGPGSLDLFNSAGRPVRSLPFDSRNNTIAIPLTGLPAGVYHYRLNGISGPAGRGTLIHE